MTSLQKIELGTPPSGSDGDTTRTANTKMNSNVDVLSAQAALTSASDTVVAPQVLTAADHLGKRVNIALAAAGAVSPPPASTCTPDSVILLRNTGPAPVSVPPAIGSGDTVALSTLNPGESVLIDTDGVHAWGVLMRGRTASDNEMVNGNSTVTGNEAVGGTLAVAGSTTLAGGVVGAANFDTRPTFVGKIPFDSGNLVDPLTATDNLASVANAAAARTNLGVGRTLIETQNVSVLSQIIFKNLTAEYATYEIVFSGACGGATAGSIAVQGSTDNGATFIGTASYTWAAIFSNPASTTAGAAGAAADTLISAQVSYPANASGQSMNGSIRFSNLSTTIIKMVRITQEGYGSDGSLYNSSSAGSIVTASVINAVKLSCRTSGISGIFSLYGCNQ